MSWRTLCASLPSPTLLNTAAYVSLFAQLGAASRILVGELFSGKCAERRPNGDLSWIPCVASTGIDESHGGALFRDLPANILGCFIMGLLASTATLKMLFPSLDCSDDRPVAAAGENSMRTLQESEALQVGLKTGFCGACTTFASWKLQMVQMLLSGKGVFHASQWLGTITGLMIGAMTALSALVFGQHVALGLFQWNQKRATTNHKSESPQSEEPRQRCPVILTATVLTLFALLSAGALYGVLSENGAGFWRRFCASVLMAPLGALLRWHLSGLNPSDHLCMWFPRGTFLANMLACIISFLSQGIDTRWSDIHPRYIVLLVALRTGLAGSLSTVSTWVVEIQKLMSGTATLSRAYAYLIVSQVLALLMGIVIYGAFIWA